VLLAGVKSVGSNCGHFLGRAAALKELRVRQCCLQSIPEPVLELTALRLLDVSSNAVSQVKISCAFFRLSPSQSANQFTDS